jgi:mannose-6-phosphate isomerase-like protein (cupin superfamily)
MAVVIFSLDDLRAGKRLQGEAIAMRVVDGPATIRNDDFDEVLYVLEEDVGIYLPRGEELQVDVGQTLLSVLGPAQTRVSGPHRVRLEDAPVQQTGDRWYRELIQSEITQFVGSIPPGRAPDHFHLYEEMLCILKGSGFLWAGKSKTPIGPGSCAYLPKRQVHCVENTTSDELRILGVFYPAGSPAVRYSVKDAPDDAPNDRQLDRRK